MINIAIGGLTAKRALPRLHKHALIHQPDLMIVSFGVNDVNEPLEDYLDALKEIFSDCLAAGCEVVFMSECMMNTYVAPDTAEELVAYATKTAQMQNSGKVDLYFERAIALAKEMGVAVADCYARWKELSKTQDITLLLANRINHPIPEMHQLFADCLYETIIGAPISTIPSGESMMYRA
jgi:lysophospholipase L1-like esterase